MMKHVVWTPGMPLEQLEKQQIEAELEFRMRNKTATASVLGISVRTLDAKLERYENEREEQRIRDEQRRKKEEDFSRKSRGLPPLYETSTSPSSDKMETEQRIHVESSQELTTELSVPLPERKEVQTVLPTQYTDFRAKKRG